MTLLLADRCLSSLSTAAEGAPKGEREPGSDPWTSLQSVFAAAAHRQDLHLRGGGCPSHLERVRNEISGLAHFYSVF